MRVEHRTAAGNDVISGFKSEYDFVGQERDGRDMLRTARQAECRRWCVYGRLRFVVITIRYAGDLHSVTSQVSSRWKTLKWPIFTCRAECRFTAWRTWHARGVASSLTQVGQSTCVTTYYRCARCVRMNHQYNFRQQSNDQSSCFVRNSASVLCDVWHWFHVVVGPRNIVNMYAHWNADN